MFNTETLVNNPTFQRVARAMALLTGIVFLFLTVLFLTRSPLARSIWPWSYTTLSPLSYVFLASVTFSVAIPLLYMALIGDLSLALRGAFNLGTVFGGSGIFMLQTYPLQPASNQQRVLNGAIFCFLMVFGSLVTWWTTRKFKFAETRPTPKLVHVSFGIYMVVLLIAGILLILKQPIFPWRLSGEASIVYGWFFLGAAVYFGHSVLRPAWGNAKAQLLAFLAYDVVLLLPFLALFSTVEPDLFWNLVIYTIVLIYSSIVSIYYLFVHPETRWRLRHIS